MLLKIIGVGVCTIIINIILKQYKPEFALLANVCGGLVLFILVIDGVQNIVDNFIYLQDVTGLKTNVVTPILKVLGVGYVTEFTSDLAEESGNKSVANKIILGGKVSICLLALPIIKMLINTILSLI